MPNTLVTSAFGNVGRSTVAACLAEGDMVTVLEADSDEAEAALTASPF